MKLLFDVMLEIFFASSHVNKPEFAYANRSSLVAVSNV